MNEDIRLYKSALSTEEASAFYNDILSSVTWHNELTNAEGAIVKIPRKMAYVADEPVVYKYANLSLPGDTWNDVLLQVKTIVEQKTGYKFNSVLLNLYEDGKDEIRWHSDKEAQLGDTPVIVCLNLGTSRTFKMLRKETGEKEDYLLEHGDILVMLEHCQERWLHAILKEKHVTEPRISLTFRWVHSHLM